MTAATLPVDEALTHQLFQRRMKPTELTRTLNVSQTTIPRSLSGKTSHPHQASIKPIYEE